MQNGVVIFGAGGHTRSLIPLLLNVGEKILGIYDDSFVEGKNELISGIPVIGKILDYNGSSTIVLSYGEANKRKQLAEIYKTQLLKNNLIFNSSIINPRVSMGEMNQIFTGAIINSEAIIGNNNIINSGAIIEHEVCIGSFNHISVGAVICGRVKIGNNCFIGAGATVIDKILIVNNVTIGAGSVVIRDITEPGIYVGNPVKKIK